MIRNISIALLCVLLPLAVAGCYYWFISMRPVSVQIPVHRSLDSVAKLDVVPLTREDSTAVIDLVSKAKVDKQNWRELDGVVEALRSRPGLKRFAIVDGESSFRQMPGPILLFIADKGCGHFRVITVGKGGAETEITENDFISEF